MSRGCNGRGERPTPEELLGSRGAEAGRGLAAPSLHLPHLPACPGLCQPQLLAAWLHFPGDRRPGASLPTSPFRPGRHGETHSPLKGPDSLWCLSNWQFPAPRLGLPDLGLHRLRPGLAATPRSPQHCVLLACWTASSPVPALTPQHAGCSCRRTDGPAGGWSLPASLLPSVPTCGPLTWSRRAAASGKAAQSQAGAWGRASPRNFPPGLAATARSVLVSAAGLSPGGGHVGVRLPAQRPGRLPAPECALGLQRRSFLFLLF